MEVDLTNRSGTPQHVRLDVGGRGGDWLALEADGRTPAQDDLLLSAGATQTVRLVASPPASAGPAGQLVPFRLRATSLEDPASSSTVSGLLVVGAPEVLTAALEPAVRTTVGRTATFTLTLGTTRPDGVLVSLRPTASRGGATVDPVALRVSAGERASATVVVRTQLPALLREGRSRVEVVWETDVRDGVAHGTARGELVQRPPLSPALSAVLLAVLISAALVALRPVWDGRLPDVLGAGDAKSTAGPASPGGPADLARPVRRPYVQLRSVLKQPDPARAQEQAEQEVARWNAAGLDVRLVDGTALPGQGPRGGDFLAVVRDGFRDLAEAQQFCRQHERQVDTCLPVG